MLGNRMMVKRNLGLLSDLVRGILTCLKEKESDYAVPSFDRAPYPVCRSFEQRRGISCSQSRRLRGEDHSNLSSNCYAHNCGIKIRDSGGV